MSGPIVNPHVTTVIWISEVQRLTGFYELVPGLSAVLDFWCTALYRDKVRKWFLENNMLMEDSDKGIFWFWT